MVIANSVKTSTPKFLISDISLSEFGRKEIKIAETEMPGLMALRDKYQSEKPLKGAKNSWKPPYDYSDSSFNRNSC